MADANTQAKRLYLIEILHQTTTPYRVPSRSSWLYLIEILHQTTTDTFAPLSVACCILSKFYIKPQLAIHPAADLFVVSYRNSTSNHNKNRGGLNFDRLYLIEILHQTTTNVRRVWERKWLYLIEILHQTTTMADANTQAKRLYLIEILHQTTTPYRVPSRSSWLYLIEILHQTTTDTFAPLSVACCILSKFYIKPQLAIHPAADLFVVSYRNSTSNHNFPPRIVCKYGVVSYRNSTSNHN